MDKYIKLWGKKVTSNNVEELVREHYTNDPNQLYTIEEGDFMVTTGKEGMIKFEVEFIKKVIDRYGLTK